MSKEKMNYYCCSQCEKEYIIEGDEKPEICSHCGNDHFWMELDPEAACNIHGEIDRMSEQDQIYLNQLFLR